MDPSSRFIVTEEKMGIVDGGVNTRALWKDSVRPTQVGLFDPMGFWPEGSHLFTMVGEVENAITDLKSAYHLDPGSQGSALFKHVPLLDIVSLSLTSR